MISKTPSIIKAAQTFTIAIEILVNASQTFSSNWMACLTSRFTRLALMKSIIVELKIKTGKNDLIF